MLASRCSCTAYAQLDAGLVPDEDAAKEFCKELALRLTGGASAGPPPKAADPHATRKLDQAVAFGDEGWHWNRGG